MYTHTFVHVHTLHTSTKQNNNKKKGTTMSSSYTQEVFLEIDLGCDSGIKRYHRGFINPPQVILMFDQDDLPIPWMLAR